jgi:hypothetical protein
LTAQDRAERWILSILLAEPQRWHEVQKMLSPGEFSDTARRELADVYWDHQRHEGEPVFNEFLSVLASHEGLTELAVELVEEFDSIAEPTQTLSDSMNHLREIRGRREEQKLVADLRRTSDEPLTAKDQDDLLRRLSDQARKPDLRRVGF